MTDLAPALLAFFLWGLSRGLTTCLFLCAPGMIPVLVNERAGVLRSLWLGFLLSLPRVLLLTLLGAVIGYLSFETLHLAQVKGAFWWTSVAAYLFLGLLLIAVGARLLGGYGESGSRRDGTRSGGRKAARKRRGRPGCDEPRRSAWGRFWTNLSARIYPGSGKSDTLFLLWGGVLSLACLAEVGLLEGVAAGAVSGGEASVGYSAGLGAALMLSLSLGATIPIMAAAAVGGSLVERVRDRKRLELVKGVMAMLMVMLGLYFVFREVYLAITTLGWY
jgi:sulfite exporter TauE/SafE